MVFARLKRYGIADPSSLTMRQIVMYNRRIIELEDSKRGAFLLDLAMAMRGKEDDLKNHIAELLGDHKDGR